ncbi:hypothetical protein NIES2119_25790 [[Phormidium ambiguum] IAM M-71]|uniref:Uncharacterized protein n=1 Tax=[Phormidium ambiguum] IAM M-71 TaxID=454136 RepID=A0A1U7I837_9CYAN|nr:hypothetical protein [Phormidium ambiguum]OKH32553.1 hypothetical protein NIES2119_25790 [Phormidium ambiguum IAM M-71]
MSTQQEYEDENTMTASGEERQGTKMLKVDGDRPIDESNLQVQYVLSMVDDRLKRIKFKLAKRFP